MEKIFLYRIKNSDDRDCCAYLKDRPIQFICGNYFGRIILHGSCYSNSNWKSYDEIETILTKDEYETLREADKEITALGYSIEPSSERYQIGIALAKKTKPIFDKLKGKKAKRFFKRIVEDEKRIVMDDFGLDEDEVEESFDNYPYDYQDRSIIGAVYYDAEELGREEACALGYVNEGVCVERYFDFERFGNDLVEGKNYQELASGKCVSYML